TSLAQNLAGAVAGVPLADPAKVHAHALSPEKGGAGFLVHLQVAIVDERQPLRDPVRIGKCVVLVLRVELPEVAERSKGDIEGAARPLADLIRGRQRVAYVGAD